MGVFDGDSDVPGFWLQPFVAQITGNGTLGGLNTYDWTEQTFDEATGSWVEAQGARSGTAAGGPYLVELNNLFVSTPLFVQVFTPGVLIGDPYYYFSAPASCCWPIGSGSGSGGGGTVPSPCCPGVGIPATLHLTIGGSCTCANATYALVYGTDPGDPLAWHNGGDGVCSGSLTKWNFECNSTTGKWSLGQICNGVTLVYSVDIVNVTCNPFDTGTQTVTYIGPTACCSGSTGVSMTWRVTV